MAWTDLSAAFGANTILTSAQMQSLRDNITALAEGAAGAPEIVNAALKTSTGSTSGTVNNNASVDITMQDYCFFPYFYGAVANLLFAGFSTDSSGTTGRFSIKNYAAGDGRAYEVEWRYVTASDKPFLFALRGKNTGKILHLWLCDDPPPALWGLDELPKDFLPPVIVHIDEEDCSLSEAEIDDILNADRIVIHKLEQEFKNELLSKAKQDKQRPFELLDNDFEFDADKNLFINKNLLEI